MYAEMTKTKIRKVWPHKPANDTVNVYGRGTGENKVFNKRSLSVYVDKNLSHPCRWLTEKLTFWVTNLEKATAFCNRNSLIIFLNFISNTTLIKWPSEHIGFFDCICIFENNPQFVGLSAVIKKSLNRNSRPRKASQYQLPLTLDVRDYAYLRV